MFELSKLPLPLQGLISGLPATVLIKLFQMITVMKDKKLEQVAVKDVNEMVNLLNLPAGPKAVEIVVEHMAGHKEKNLEEWFSVAAQDGLFETIANSTGSDEVFVRCEHCHQPFTINLKDLT